MQPPSLRRAPRWIAIEHPVDDHRQDTAIDDDLFAIVRRDFEYDDRELDAKIESTDDGPESLAPRGRFRALGVRRRAVTDSPVPAEERRTAVPDRRLLPAVERAVSHGQPHPSFPFAYFIPKSGRALVYPIYQGTYERQIDRRGPNDDRDYKIQLGKDLRRTVDFLETREDIDSEKLAYYGLSWGAYEGPLMTAIEPRFAGKRARGGRVAALPG